MAQFTGNEHAQYVCSLFGRIAPHYDLLNRLMTGGQDVRWRRETIRRARLSPADRLLDLGAGTGDLAREALRQQPAVRVVAADFTMGMMRAGLQHGALNWASADALRLPFGEATFDAVVSGFLMRNVGDLGQALTEQFRALQPGGRVVILDTTRPGHSLLSPFIWFHLHAVIPFLGWLISGSADAYTYLPDSTENFLRAEDLAGRMAAAGFQKVGFRRLMFGVAAIHWGEKGEAR